MTEIRAMEILLELREKYDGYSIEVSGSIARDTLIVRIHDPGNWTRWMRVYDDTTEEEMRDTLAEPRA